MRHEGPSLLNRRAVRALVLEEVRMWRPGWNPTRVSPLFLDEIERKVCRIVHGAVHAHPSVGQTVREIL